MYFKDTLVNKISNLTNKTQVYIILGHKCVSRGRYSPWVYQIQKISPRLFS